MQPPAGSGNHWQRACGCPKLCRGWSGRVSGFVDESVAAGRSDDSKLGWTWAMTRGRVVVEWGSLIEGAVRPVGVVVVDVVGDEAFELSLVPDDGAVEQLAAQGPDPAFGERVRDREGAEKSSGLLSGSLHLGSGEEDLGSAALKLATSGASTRPNWSATAAHGAASTTSNSPPSNGSTGSTTNTSSTNSAASVVDP